MKRYLGFIFPVLFSCIIQTSVAPDNPVVIVGGGLAGLAAADMLINQLDFTTVTVIEALDRIGGRVKPVKNPQGTGYFDLGSEFIHGRVFNPVYEAAERLNALATPAETAARDGKQTKWYTETGCNVVGGLLDSMRQMLNFLDDLVNTMASVTGQTMSVKQMYETSYNNYKAQFGGSWGKAENFYKGAMKFVQKEAEADMSTSDWGRVSAKSWKFYEEPPEDIQIYMGQNGHKPLLDDFLTKIGETNIKFKTLVSKITYEADSQVTIEMADGSTMIADHVIVTSSLGYLKANSDRLFSPQLPVDYTTAINGIGFDAVDKLYLVYTTPFWASDFGRQYFIRVDNDPWNCAKTGLGAESDLSKIFWYFEVHPTIPNVLEAVIAGGTDPDLLERASEARLILAATEALRRFTNKNTIPFASRAIKSLWKNETTFLGSHSYYTPECDKQPACNAETFQKPITVQRDGKDTPVILFAGEHTHEALFDTTQGAWQSGERAAQAIADFYTPPSEKDPNKIG